MNKFFNHKTKLRGDNRELYHTNPMIIKAVVNSLLENYPELKDYVWVDPCAGDGVWEDVIEHYKVEVYSFDINPLCSIVNKRDFLKDKFDEFKNRKTFFIGNPPYSLVRKFVDRALELSDKCYFFGGSNRLTSKISEKIALLHRFENFEGKQKDRRSKLEFNTTNNEIVRVWTCGALFDKEKHDQFIQNKNKEGFAVSPIIYCKDDNRIKVIRKEDLS